jgi:hypothetical protein
MFVFLVPVAIMSGRNPLFTFVVLTNTQRSHFPSSFFCYFVIYLFVLVYIVFISFNKISGVVVLGP